MALSRFRRCALVGSVMITALALVGCSSDATVSDPGKTIADIPTGQTSTPAGTGPVDLVTWNMYSGEPASLDWLYAYADSENTALANMCEGLMRQNEDMSLTPALAEEVQHPDDLTTVFKIRDDVTFWNGNPLTAEDVAFSMNRHLDVEAGSYWGVPFYDRVESIEVTGDLEVTVRFTQPDSLFERMLATAAGIIGEQAYVEEAGEAYGTPNGGIMCTGPFAFDSWEAGSKISMTANSDYWDPELRPMVQQLNLTFVTDESTISNSLLSGDLDGTYMAPLAATEKLATSDIGSFILGLGTDWMAIRPTEKEGPMDQIEVRQALSLILDRDAIAQAVYRGTATPSLTPVQPGAWGYSTDLWQAAYDALPKPEYNVEKASELIADAGLDGAELSIALPADSEAEQKIAEMLVAGGNQIGLTITTETIPQTSFTELYFDDQARAPYDAFIVQEYGAGVADPNVTMSEFTPLSAYNYGNNDDPVLTQSLEDAYAAMDETERAEALITGQESMVENLALINVVNLEQRMFQNSRITGASASLSRLYYPWAAKIGAAE